MSENLVMLTTDSGYSGTKAIWRLAISRAELLLMSPEVVEVSRESINFYKSRRMTTPAPENEAWVEYDGKLYAVGFLAQKHFNARIAIKEPKYEWAIAKVLAVVGVMVAREGLADEFDLSLSIPLPYGEWEARQTFEKDLRGALADFLFCDKKLKVNLRMFVCVPEGGGHAMSRGEKMGAVFNQRKMMSLMWGYRDISLVLFNRGAISGITELLGFYQLIEMVTNRTFGQSSREREQMLLEAIHLAGKDLKTKNFKHLALSRHPERRAEEVEQIVEAIKISRVEYWAMVMRFLTTRIPDDVDEIIIGGGAAAYFQAELRQFFGQNYPRAALCWSADLEEEVRIAFNLPPEAQALRARLTDPYGLSNFLRRQLYPHSIVKTRTR